MAKMISLAMKENSETIKTKKVRLLQEAYEANGNRCFEDISDDQFKKDDSKWGAEYICDLKAKGIITGNNINFNPDSNITYKDASKMLLRAFSYGNIDDKGKSRTEKCWEMIESGLWYPRYVDYMNDMLHNFNKDKSKQGGENTSSSKIVSRGLFVRMLNAAFAEKKRIYNCDKFSGDFEEVVKDEQYEFVKIPIRVYPTWNESYTFELSNEWSYFKFKVEPIYHYSFIVDTGNHGHTQSVIGAECSNNSPSSKINSKVFRVPFPDYGIDGNNSPAKSATMFYADPVYCSGGYYYAYITVKTWSDTKDMLEIPVAKIRLIKKEKKHFALPMNEGVHGYYNSYGHREKIYKRSQVTEKGHDGIDITACKTQENKFDLNCSDLDDSRPVVSVADGEVKEIISLGNIVDGDGKTLKLGKVIYVHHIVNNQPYTSLYAHLQNLTVSIGDTVYKGTTLGYREKDQGHLHLEIFKNHTKDWYFGYNNGEFGQVDPLGIIFEE